MATIFSENTVTIGCLTSARFEKKVKEKGKLALTLKKKKDSNSTSVLFGEKKKMKDLLTKRKKHTGTTTILCFFTISSNFWEI